MLGPLIAILFGCGIILAAVIAMGRGWVDTTEPADDPVSVDIDL